MDYELIFWIVIDIIFLGIMICGLVLNDQYDPKGDDPYRYCPKEDE